MATSPALPEAHALGALPVQQPSLCRPHPRHPRPVCPSPQTPSASLPVSRAPDREGLLLSPQPRPIWPAGLELSAGTEGLLEEEKGWATGPHTVLRLLTLTLRGCSGATPAGGEVDEGLEAETTKVLDAATVSACGRALEL